METQQKPKREKNKACLAIGNGAIVEDGEFYTDSSYLRFQGYKLVWNHPNGKMVYLSFTSPDFMRAVNEYFYATDCPLVLRSITDKEGATRFILKNSNTGAFVQLPGRHDSEAQISFGMEGGFSAVNRLLNITNQPAFDLSKLQHQQ